MKKILVTGSNGLIGSNLCKWLLANTDDDIVGVDNLSGGLKENIIEQSDRFVGYIGDVCNQARIDNIFNVHKPDIVYHFAAYAAENLSPFIRCFNYTNNLVGTANIVNNCIKHNIKRLVFSSSIAVYGHGEPPFTEEDIPNPQDPYANAKYACEIDIQIAGKQHGLDWCIVRPYNVYGVGQNIFDKYRNVVGIFIWQLLNNKPMTIFGDGKQVRGFTNVQDILTPLYYAGRHKNCSKQIFNLGSNNKRSVRDVAEILQQISDTGDVEYLEKRFEATEAYCNNSKAKNYLCYQDKTHLFEGIREMYFWAKTLKMRPQSEWNEFEINKGMYKAWEKI